MKPREKETDQIRNGRFPVHDGTMKPGAKRGTWFLLAAVCLSDSFVPSLLPWLRVSWKPGRRLGGQLQYRTVQSRETDR